MKNIRIETFNDMQDAFLFMETEMEWNSYVKAEVFKTIDGRFRVSLMDSEETQLEMEV